MKKKSIKEVSEMPEEQEMILDEKEKEKEDNRRRYIIFLLLLLILMFFATFGITYTLYKGDSGNSSEIITNNIIFTYSDVDRSGSGIQIKEALPITDEVGKNLFGTNQYFDFSVTATSKNSKLKYKLLARKGSDSTIDNDNIRIYLTSLSGNLEKEVLLTDFSKLRQEKIKNVNYYVLYEKELDKGIENYSDLYRLRMWIKEDATDYDLKKFSLNVDVTAEQVGD